MNSTLREVGPLLIAALLGLGSMGCVSTGTLGLVTVSSADPGRLLREPHSYHELGHREGQACRFFVLSIIPFGDSTFSKALERALQESGGGNALLNVSVSSSLYGFIPIYNLLSFTCTTVQGTAIKIETLGP